MGDVYSAPVAETLRAPERLSTQDLRERFLREEMVVLAVGWFYYFIGSVLLSVAVLLVMVEFTRWLPSFDHLFLISLTLFVAGILYLMIGYGLRRFDSWARCPAIVASIASVVLMPIGFLASPVCLVLLRANAVKEIFTAEYQTAVVAEGEMIKHYGWLAVVGGLLTAVTLFLLFYLLTQGYLQRSQDEAWLIW